MLIMPDIHVRNVESDLLRKLNVAAASESVSQREFVIRAITEALNGPGQTERVAAPSQVRNVRSSLRERSGLDEGRPDSDAEARRSPDRAQPNTGAMAERSRVDSKGQTEKRWLGHKHAASCDCGNCP